MEKFHECFLIKSLHTMRLNLLSGHQLRTAVLEGGKKSPGRVVTCNILRLGHKLHHMALTEDIPLPYSFKDVSATFDFTASGSV